MEHGFEHSKSSLDKYTSVLVHNNHFARTYFVMAQLKKIMVKPICYL
jgi:hypothetical protein